MTDITKTPRVWTTDEIAADICKDNKYKVPEQATVEGRLAARVMELKAQNARQLNKINTWMPIVAASQENYDLPDDWSWRQPWEHTAVGPEGLVCEPDYSGPWSEDEIPKAVAQTVSRKASSTRWGIYANQRAIKAEELHRPRDPRNGEAPTLGTSVLAWRDGHWSPGMSTTERCLWLPAPPAPEVD